MELNPTIQLTPEEIAECRAQLAWLYPGSETYHMYRYILQGAEGKVDIEVFLKVYHRIAHIKNVYSASGLAGLRQAHQDLLSETQKQEILEMRACPETSDSNWNRCNVLLDYSKGISIRMIAANNRCSMSSILRYIDLFRQTGRVDVEIPKSKKKKKRTKHAY